MHYYILTINDTDAELQKRINANAWPVYSRTHNAKKLRSGDKVIFYRAGYNQHQFVGHATIQNDTTEQSRNIEFSSTHFWDTSIDIKSVYDKLNIIKNPKHYGVYLAGGIKKITAQDYNFLYSKAESM